MVQHFLTQRGAGGESARESLWLVLVVCCQLSVILFVFAYWPSFVSVSALCFSVLCV